MGSSTRGQCDIFNNLENMGMAEWNVNNIFTSLRVRVTTPIFIRFRSKFCFSQSRNHTESCVMVWNSTGRISELWKLISQYSTSRKTMYSSSSHENLQFPLESLSRFEKLKLFIFVFEKVFIMFFLYRMKKRLLLVFEKKKSVVN